MYEVGGEGQAGQRQPAGPRQQRVDEAAVPRAGPGRGRAEGGVGEETWFETLISMYCFN